MTRADETKRALVAELERHGIADYRIQRGGDHYKIFFKAPGRTKERFFVFAGSPSDRRGLQNSVSDLRKMIGPQPKAKKTAKPKRAKSNTPKRVKMEPIASAPKNPFDALGVVRARLEEDHPAPGEVIYVGSDAPSLFMRILSWIDGGMLRLLKVGTKPDSVPSIPPAHRSNTSAHTDRAGSSKERRG